MTVSTSSIRANPIDYLPPRPSGPATHATHPVTGPALAPIDLDSLIQWISAQGFVFQPWQVAAFVTAVRTKPFVILAGISGTGKTKLPALVSEATQAACEVVEVKPNWTDSDELIGYERLDGTWVPGRLLRIADRAMHNPGIQHFLVLDEMNVARVEYYLAEVLSLIERRVMDQSGQISGPVIAPSGGSGSTPNGIAWNEVTWPSNLCLVGSVNMDETTFGFSRKVLDRAFVIEFTDVVLDDIGDGETTQPAVSADWPSPSWKPAALSLPAHPHRNRPAVAEAIEALTALNAILKPAQLQVGYRVRDEVAMFTLAAEESSSSFRTSEDGPVDPLDLAIAMKVLPRIQGGGQAVRDVLMGLDVWAKPAEGSEGRSFPFCADRIEMMRQRFDDSGFTSYWL